MMIVCHMTASPLTRNALIQSQFELPIARFTILPVSCHSSTRQSSPRALKTTHKMSSLHLILGVFPRHFACWQSLYTYKDCHSIHHLYRDTDGACSETVTLLFHDEQRQRTKSWLGDFSTITLNVLVKYKSEQGKEDAKRRALMVTHESTLFHILGMEIPVSELKALQDNPNIERVDLDLQVEAILSFEEEDEEPARNHPFDSPTENVDDSSWNKYLGAFVLFKQYETIEFASLTRVMILIMMTCLEQITVTGTHSTKYAGNKWDEDK